VNPTVFDRDERKAVSSEKPSATVRGAGELSGGEYSRILLLGAGEISGDVRAERLRSFGSGEVHGSAAVESVFVYGSGSVDSDLTARRVKAVGSLDVGGRIEARKLTVTGACEVGDRIVADEIGSLGLLQCQSAEAGSFRARGAVEIEGLLSADLVVLHIGAGHSHVDVIGGERVEVWKSNFGKRSALLKAIGSLLINIGTLGVRASLSVSTIEADDVCLENTRADVVRGKRVEIGQGCWIGTVEYAETLQVHKGAQVGRRQKV